MILYLCQISFNMFFIQKFSHLQYLLSSKKEIKNGPDITSFSFLCIISLAAVCNKILPIAITKSPTTTVAPVFLDCVQGVVEEKGDGDGEGGVILDAQKMSFKYIHHRY